MNRPTRSDADGQAYLDLQNRARRQGRTTQELLILYALERFLARLTVSPHANAFVLKGGMLLAAFDARRATVDADLLATGFANDLDVVLARVREIAALTPCEDDGVLFHPDSARARVIREENLYSGVRVTMQASIATAAVKLQLDINFGDPVTPEPQLVDYPALRDQHPAVRVLGYPLATVIAEKLCTAIDLGEANTWVRDYADIWTLTRRQDLRAGELRAALAATAAHRNVALRRLSGAIGDLATSRQYTYAAFRARLGDDLPELPAQLADLIADVAAFADPLIDDGSLDVWSAAARTWSPGRHG